MYAHFLFALTSGSIRYRLGARTPTSGFGVWQDWRVIPDLLKNGAPGEIRTPDQLVRSQLLYPAELQARWATVPRMRRIYTAYLGRDRVEPTLCRIADELRVLGAAFAIDRL